jgi:hypothetical protein
MSEKKTFELTAEQVASIETAIARAVAGLHFVGANTGSKANQMVLGETIGSVVSVGAGLLGLDKDEMQKKVNDALAALKSEMAGASAIDKPSNTLPC